MFYRRELCPKYFIVIYDAAAAAYAIAASPKVRSTSLVNAMGREEIVDPSLHISNLAQMAIRTDPREMLRHGWQ
jgi:hypothetical protein